MKHSYTLKAPAKINLLLEIIGDRADGFHELVMVLQSIDLADIVQLHPLGGDRIEIHCNHPEIPCDQRNLAYRAARLLQDKYPGNAGVSISLQKNIPIGAGLAGGSTDAAAVLVGLDLMWNLGLTQTELQDYAATLGSDIPFCVSGGTALALGRGEALTPLPDLDQLYAVLAKYQSLSVSTPWAYQTYRQQFGASYCRDPQLLDHRRRAAHSSDLLVAISHRDVLQVPQHLYNDLEKVVLPQYPLVQALRDQFEKLGALGTMMSGSGPTVFGLAESRIQAERLAGQMRVAIADPDLDLWVTQFCSSGIQLLSSSP
ncbi:MAG: 4-(cytidine 5'-diphospho)-2-C-methyl-D-erythritol kinase [Acaryochloridaceae cyanobacterium SU_2_1]|nr:4-(cytidine 5'-diphospho)-2-C-methyl-D-erythritol kinase [Acaryochloridaceae cyanobacterium SU_2_1]